jgi:hypothetical protein
MKRIRVLLAAFILLTGLIPTLSITQAQQESYPNQQILGSMANFTFPASYEAHGFTNWSYRNFPAVEVEAGHALVLEFSSNYTYLQFLHAYIFTPEQFISFQSLVAGYQGFSAPYHGMEEWRVHDYKAEAVYFETGGVVTYVAKQPDRYIGVLTNYDLFYAKRAHFDYFRESTVPYALSVTPTPSPSPTPAPTPSSYTPTVLTLPTLAILAFIVLIIVSLLVYFKKRKRV